jgi:shikimate kinase
VVKLSLIGMSGTGKSYWTRILTAAGFRSISIDDLIEKKLTAELAAGGYHGTSGVAAWMGWPDTPTYREREGKYFEHEIESMREALDEIELRSSGEGIVLDTTGSVIYTGDEICRRLQHLTTVVYLAVTADDEGVLIARYLSDPKPVLWGNQFTQLPGETVKSAVARSYPELIAHRKVLYEKFAHHVIDIARLRDPELDARGFLELLDAQARHAR